MDRYRCCYFFSVFFFPLPPFLVFKSSISLRKKTKSHIQSDDHVSITLTPLRLFARPGTQKKKKGWKTFQPPGFHVSRTHVREKKKIQTIIKTPAMLMGEKKKKKKKKKKKLNS